MFANAPRAPFQSEPKRLALGPGTDFTLWSFPVLRWGGLKGVIGLQRCPPPLEAFLYLFASGCIE